MLQSESRKGMRTFKAADGRLCIVRLLTSTVLAAVLRPFHTHARLGLWTCAGQHATLCQCSPIQAHPRAAPQVTDQGTAVGNLNELEAIDGEIWANVWLTDCIARVDPQSGVVKCVAAPAPFKFPRKAVLRS